MLPYLSTQKILQARDLYSEVSFADMYGNLPLFNELNEAHEANDIAVLEAYGFDKDLTEAEIVSRLLQLYKQRTDEIDKREAIEKAISKLVGKNSVVPEWLDLLRKLCLDGVISIEEMIEKGKAKKKELAVEERKAKKEKTTRR